MGFSQVVSHTGLFVWLSSQNCEKSRRMIFLSVFPLRSFFLFGHSKALISRDEMCVSAYLAKEALFSRRTDTFTTKELLLCVCSRWWWRRPKRTKKRWDSKNRRVFLLFTPRNNKRNFFLSLLVAEVFVIRTARKFITYSDHREKMCARMEAFSWTGRER